MHKFIQIFFRLTAVALVGLWMFQGTAEAKIYKWRDDQGKLHFTDNAAKIPEKYRDQVEKFKEDPPPPTVTPEPEAEGQAAGDPAATPSTEGGAEAPAAPGAEGETPAAETPAAETASKYSKKEAEIMNIVYKKLLAVWGYHIRLLRDTEFKESNYKQFINIAQRSYDDKKKIVNDIGKWEIPLLRDVRSFLVKTMRWDKRINGEDVDDLDKDVKDYVKRLLREIPMERELLESFNKELDLKAKPLPYLAAELADGLRRQANKNASKKGSSSKDDISSGGIKGP